jgi:hypothetical protein
MVVLRPNILAIKIKGEWENLCIKWTVFCSSESSHRTQFSSEGRMSVSRIWGHWGHFGRPPGIVLALLTMIKNHLSVLRCPGPLSPLPTSCLPQKNPCQERGDDPRSPVFCADWAHTALWATELVLFQKGHRVPVRWLCDLFSGGQCADKEAIPHSAASDVTNYLLIFTQKSAT